jgi:hypothetical protein
MNRLFVINLNVGKIKTIGDSEFSTFDIQSRKFQSGKAG